MGRVRGPSYRKVVRPVRFELTTFCSGGKRSIPISGMETKTKELCAHPSCQCHTRPDSSYCSTYAKVRPKPPISYVAAAMATVVVVRRRKHLEARLTEASLRPRRKTPIAPSKSRCSRGRTKDLDQQSCFEIVSIQRRRSAVGIPLVSQ